MNDVLRVVVVNPGDKIAIEHSWTAAKTQRHITTNIFLSRELAEKLCEMLQKVLSEGVVFVEERD